MTDSSTLDIQRKRLRFRSWHRGTREADLLLGSFADRHVDSFNERQLSEYAAILERSDPDIYNWMTEREPVPPELQTGVMDLLKAHQYSPTSH